MEKKKNNDKILWRGERSVRYAGGEWMRGRLLGQGSFGRVNLAYFPDPSSRNFPGMPFITAVKSCPMSGPSEELATERKILERFKDCPSIVQCLGYDVTFDHEPLLNVFLEYASGGTLGDHVASARSGLPEPQVRRFTNSILGAIHRVHQEGYVHCDVKLDNILLFERDDGLTAKLADFGLARPACDFRPGMICGTELYWAPEVSISYGGIQGQPSDIWALGCVVLAMLTGALPCRGGHVTLPRRVFSESAEDFVYKCFRKDPQKRATAETLLHHPFITGAPEDSDFVFVDYYDDELAIESYLKEISEITNDDLAMESYLKEISEFILV